MELLGLRNKILGLKVKTLGLGRWKMKKVICDYCNKESDNAIEYVFPEYVTYEAKDSKGNIVCKFASNNEIHSVTRDICLNCANKIARLLASME